MEGCVLCIKFRFQEGIVTSKDKNSSKSKKKMSRRPFSSAYVRRFPLWQNMDRWCCIAFSPPKEL